MTDPSAPPTREEAMAAIREAEIWTGDGGTIEMGSREDATTLLTLARAGAKWMFASEEDVESNMSGKLTWQCPRCGGSFDARVMNHGDSCPARLRASETDNERRERLRKYPDADKMRG